MTGVVTGPTTGTWATVWVTVVTTAGTACCTGETTAVTTGATTWVTTGVTGAVTAESVLLTSPVRPSSGPGRSSAWAAEPPVKSVSAAHASTPKPPQRTAAGTPRRVARASTFHLPL